MRPRHKSGLVEGQERRMGLPKMSGVITQWAGAVMGLDFLDLTDYNKNTSPPLGPLGGHEIPCADFV